jgi:hypothetical protein
MWLLGKVLGQLANLDELEFKNTDSVVTANGYKELSHGLDQLKSLTKLKLNLNLINQPVLSMHYLFQCIKGMNKLEKLDIAFSSGAAVSNELLFALGDCIKNLPNLTSLRISLKSLSRKNNDPVEAGINQLIKSLEQLVNIKKLELEFLNAELSPENLIKLATTLELFKQLSTLSLKFTDRLPYDDKAFGKLAESIAVLKQLKTFKFACWQNLSGDSISYIAKAISCLPLLVSLSFKLCDNLNLTDEKWKEITQAFVSLKHLEELDLDLHYCRSLSDPAIQHLCNSIQDLKLMSFKLALGAVKLSNTSLYSLAKIIEISRKTLKECSINLGDCIRDDENGIVALITSIGNLESLTALNLRLNGYTPITEEGLKKVGPLLGQLIHLTQLYMKLQELINLQMSSYAVKKFTEESETGLISIVIQGGDQ